VLLVVGEGGVGVGLLMLGRLSFTEQLGIGSQDIESVDYSLGCSGSFMTLSGHSCCSAEPVEVDTLRSGQLGGISVM
jgi:hypothetical protein